MVAKAIVELATELELQGRKEKKEKQDLKEEQEQVKLKAQQDAASKKEFKKDAKKDSKVDKKAGEKLPEEVPSDDKAKEAPEKEYKKNMDCLYYIYDVPKSEEEISEFVKANGEIDIVYNVR